MKASLGTVATAGLGALGVITAVRTVRTAARLREMRGQVVVIVGGSRGLGLALARHFVDLGCRVAIGGREERTLERARAELMDRGGKIVAMPVDASDDLEVDRFVDLVMAVWGRIDVLVTTAGTIQVGPLQTMTLHDHRHAMESLFWSAAHPTLAVLPIMRKQGSGSIAHVTSIGGRIAVPHLVPYCSAKFAAIGFSEGVRAEVARFGIRVTTVIPGLMRTGSHVHARFKGKEAREYAWFGLGATSPIAVDADRAARAIVRAIARGDEELVIGLPAVLADRLHAWIPWLTRRASTLAARLLPRALRESPGEPAEEGLDIERSDRRPSIRAVARMGHDEAQRYGQL